MRAADRLGVEGQRIGVLGAGAIGSYVAGRLAQAGQAVTLIVRDAGTPPAAQRALSVFHGAELVASAEVRVETITNVGMDFDYLFLAVPAPQVARVVEQSSSLLAKARTVVTLQNGVRAPYLVSPPVDPSCVIGAVCWFSVRAEDPTRVVLRGGAPRMDSGPAQPGPLGATTCANFRELLTGAGFDVRLRDECRSALWKKLLFIATVSGLGAACRATVGQLRDSPEVAPLLERSLREIQAVARAYGAAIEEDDVEDVRAFIDALPAGVTSSLQRDLDAGRPDELDALSGDVVRLGAARGVATPLHDVLWRVLTTYRVTGGPTHEGLRN